MSPITVGFIGIAVLIVAFINRIPVAFAMMTVGLAGSLYLLPANAAFRLSSVFEPLSLAISPSLPRASVQIPSGRKASRPTRLWAHGRGKSIV